jgi:hypothetical protein
MSLFHRTFLLAILATSCLSSGAFATETPTEKPQDKPIVNDQGGVVYSPLLPSKIHPRQTTADGLSIAAATVEKDDETIIDKDSLGLIEKAPEGAINADMWKEFSRNSLNASLTNPLLKTSSPTMNNLLRRALISKTDSSVLNADRASAITEGGVSALSKTLFEIRLNALIHNGFYDDVLKLYRKLGDEGTSNPIYAILGVKSMIGAGQMGTACLENRVIAPAQKLESEKQFWSEVTQFCDTLLSPASAQDRNEYDALGRAARAYSELNVLKTIGVTADLNPLSPIALLAHHRSNRIGKGVLTDVTMSSLDARVLSSLYAVTPPRSDDSYLMLSHLIRRGFKDSNDLATAYKNHTQALRKQSQASGKDLKKGTKDKSSNWTNLALIYSDLMSADQSALPPVLLKNAMTTAQSLPNAALLPFAAEFASQNDLSGFTANDAKKALWVMLMSNMSPPIQWVNLAYGIESNSVTVQNGDELLLKTIMKDPSTSLSTTPSPILSTSTLEPKSNITPPAQSPENPQNSGVSVERDLYLAYLLGEPNDIKLKKVAYDNVFSLTPQNNYVMTNVETVNELLNALQNMQTGQVILKSVETIGQNPVSSWSGVEFSSVLDALYSVGLNEDVKSLIRETLAGRLQSVK